MTISAASKRHTAAVAGMATGLNGSWARALSLAVALVISVGLLAWPTLVVTTEGHVDHGWLMVLMWGMAAGYVHGVGFIPRNRLLRVALGPLAAWGLALLAALALIWH